MYKFLKLGEVYPVRDMSNGVGNGKELLNVQVTCVNGVDGYEIWYQRVGVAIVVKLAVPRNDTPRLHV